jgi:hypothetical protein
VVKLYTCIQEALTSNLNQDIDYTEVPPPSLQANPGSVLEVRPQPLPSTSFPIHYSLFILALNAV